MFQEIYNIVSCVILMIVFHEFGHVLYLVVHKYSAKTIFRLKPLELHTITPDLPRSDRKNMIKLGIWMGLTPIIYLFFLSYNIFYVLLALFYLFVGCKSDIDSIN